MTSEKMNNRFTHRLCIAQWSFPIMNLTLLGLIIFALISDANAQRAANIQ